MKNELNEIEIKYQGVEILPTFQAVRVSGVAKNVKNCANEVRILLKKIASEIVTRFVDNPQMI